MSQEKSYTGRCFCGAVEIKVTGDAAGQGFCHCRSCRSWSAGPVNAFTLWKTDSVAVTKGKDRLKGFALHPQSKRMWCEGCGGHVMTEHEPWGLIDVYAATIPDFPFTPGVHVHYQETVLPIKDGLPKQKDIPAELGGSGQLIPE
jgi:hypothetical protein